MDAPASPQGRLESASRKVGGGAWIWIWVVVLTLLAGLPLAYLASTVAPSGTTPAPSTAGAPPAPVIAGTGSPGVTVYGEVHRQGRYHFLPGERVADAVLRAGGPTAAAKERVKIIRKVPGKGNVTLRVNLKDVLTKKMPGKDIPLLPGDTIIVEERLINF